MGKRSFLKWVKRHMRPIVLDAYVDDGLFRLGCFMGRVFSGYSSFCRRLHCRGFKKFFVEILDEGATFGTIGLVFAFALALPAFEEVREDWRANQDYSITILDRFGNEIGKRGVLLNDTVPLSDIPDHLIRATLATEDRRFFTHFGIDVMGTMRAIIANARADEVVQGGSSITQQLAKNLFLTNERTLSRKIKEAYLALWLEYNLTKEEILKLYLDRAYMGGGAFGVVAATEFYFDKDVRELSLAEAAMLSGLYKAPTKFAPHIDLSAARARANEVLSNMVEAGFLKESQVLTAMRNPATPVLRNSDQAPDFFLDYVFEQAKEKAPPGKKVFTVRSTLDPRLQNNAQNVIEANLRQFGADYNVRQAAAVLMENQGAVRAMVGGRDYGRSQFNRATDALRQPGSSFKTFVYAAAMANGYTPRSVVADAPICIGNWCPKNYTRKYAGSVDLKYALTKSINTIPVRLAQRMGRDKIVDMAYKMGISSELKITRALPLGVAEVTVLDMAAAYAVLGNSGYQVEPYAVLDIRDNEGEVLYTRYQDARSRQLLLSDDVVRNMNDMLVNVSRAGTGRRAQIENINVAGKTGTTQGYRDAWFIGYTGNFAAAVWYGNDDFTSTRRLTGGNLPAMTWQAIVSEAHRGVPAKPLLGVDAVFETEMPIADGDADNEGRVLFQNTAMPEATRRALMAIHKRLERAVSGRDGSDQAVFEQQSLLLDRP